MALAPVRIMVPDYSQDGEGQIILEILGRLPELDRQCIEVGASDGMQLSNTRHLSECFGYTATLIEPLAWAVEAIRANGIPGTKVIPKKAGWTPTDSIDSMEEIPDRPDFVSIDVDGCDYHVWSAMFRVRQKVLCIEFNPTIPNDVLFIQEADPETMHGSSLRAMVELGKAKGYELVAVSTFNAIFVESQYYPLMEIADNRIDTMRPFAPCATYIFTGYDGRVFLSGAKRIPWHPVEFKESAFQVMPKYFQQYSHGKIKSLMFRLWLKSQDVKDSICRRFQPNTA
jgi:hypothetical protein